MASQQPKLKTDPWFPKSVLFSGDDQVIELEHLASETVFDRMIAISWLRKSDGMVTFRQIRRDLAGKATDGQIADYLKDLERVGLICLGDDEDSYLIPSFTNWNKSNDAQSPDFKKMKSKWGGHIGQHVRNGATPSGQCRGCDYHVAMKHSGSVHGCVECDKAAGDDFAHWAIETKGGPKVPLTPLEGDIEGTFDPPKGDIKDITFEGVRGVPKGGHNLKQNTTDQNRSKQSNPPRTSDPSGEPEVNGGHVSGLAGWNSKPDGLTDADRERLTAEGFTQ